MPLEVRPFADEHVADAGRLLAERHRRHRAAEPLLSPRYEEPDVAAAQVAAAFAEPDASGAVALRDGEAVGYLLGAPKTSPVWGANIFVESSGHAAAADDPETARELYAVAAGRWVDEGRTVHYALLPAHDTALVGGWFRLGFGHQHTHGIQEAPSGPPTPLADGVVVRPAERADFPALARLDVALPAHQKLPPTLSPQVVPTYEEKLAEWEDDIDDPDYVYVVAEHNGRVVGSAVGCALEQSSMHTGPARPDRAWFLGFAAVDPDARGLGAGRAIGEGVASYARERGCDVMVTDWRETNLLSSRAWRGLGYRESFIRVHRTIGY